MDFTDFQDNFFIALKTGLGFNKTDYFQLLRPPCPIAVSGNKADQLLWDYFNNIPSHSTSHQYIASNGCQFLNNYAGLLSSLTPPSGDLEAVVGKECVEKWNNYLLHSPVAITLEALPSLFQGWAKPNGFSSVALQGKAVLEKLVNETIFIAQRKFQLYRNPDGTYKNPYWESGISELRKQLGNSLAKSFKMNDLSLTIDASFKNVLIFTPKPGHWYNPKAMALAYKNKSGYPWRPNSSIRWDDTFDPVNGNLARFATSLIVVNRMDILVTSQGAYTKTEQDQIRTNSAKSVCPFNISSSEHLGSDLKFTGDGRMTITISSRQGTPIIIGMMVKPVDSFIAEK